MFKKMAFVLLSLNLLTSKPVAAFDPFTWTCIYYAATATGGGICGWWKGSSGKAEVEAEKNKVVADNVKIKNQITELKAQAQRELAERKASAEKAFQQCFVSDERRSALARFGISNACESLEKSVRKIQELSSQDSHK